MGKENKKKETENKEAGEEQDHLPVAEVVKCS